MRQKPSKLIAVILSVILMLSCFFVTTSAAEEALPGTPITELAGKYKTQGRTPIVNDTLMLDWTAAGIEWEANCSGDVTVTLNATRMGHTDVEADGGLYFTVYVDGVMQAADLRIPETVDSTWTSNSTNYPFHITALGNTTFTIAEDLPEGDHTFAIYNQTEANMGAFGVKSIELSGTFKDAPVEKDLFIEFVGDSITAGHGVLNNFNVNAPLYEDATRGWPYLTAKALDADWSVLAVSGITAIDGIGWSGAGSVNMQDVYPFETYYSDKTLAHDFANSKKPDVIVLGLGTNDCWTWNGTGGVTLTDAQKVSGFKQMLTHLRDRNPDSKIVWVYGMMSSAADEFILQAISEMGGAGNEYYSLGLTKNTAGGRGHPNLAVQSEYAADVSAFITKITTPVVQEDWEVPTEKPDYIGSGSSADPFMITNGAELYWAVTNKNEGVHFKLANDIILNEMTVDAANGAVSSDAPLKEWNTDGDDGVYFGGTIDGDNHVIKGLYIDHEYTGTASEWNMGYGLISHANGAVIKNLGIESAYVKAAGGAAAAFVGSIGNGVGNVSFENCYVGADVYLCGNQAGGFLSSGGGSKLTGGVKNCYSLATVIRTNTSYNCGGIYGPIWSMNASNFVENSFCIGLMSGFSGGTRTNCFATVDSTGCTTLSAANMQGINGQLNLCKLSDAFCVVDSGYPKLRSFVGRTNGEWSGFRDGTMGGKGTEDNPYQIKNAEQLAQIIYNGGANYYFRLTNDIYLNDITKIDWDSGTVHAGYTPCGWYGTTFKGHFDGNGHVVYGLYVNETINTSGWNGTGDALFPAMSAGSIKNVGVEYAYVQATNNAAAIVGYAGATAERTIENCYAGEKVTLRGYNAGGIYASGDANMTITNCYSLATLYGSNKFGGISGGWWSYNYGTTEAPNKTTHHISNCYTVSSKVAHAATSTKNCIAGATAVGDAAINASYNTLGDSFVRIGETFPTLKIFTDLPENIPWNGFGDDSYIVEGAGTEANPYMIETAAQLAHVIYNNGGKYYRLANDIYLNDVSSGWLDRENNLVWISSCSDYNGYGKNDDYFRGTLDGDGYVVYGLFYPDDTKCYSSALVPLMGGGTVKNIGIKEARIVALDTAAGVVGIIRPDSNKMKTVENCFADDTVSAKWTDAAMNGGAAGIVGYTSNGASKHDVTIKNCWSAATLSSAKDPNFRSNGIIGKSWDARYTIENCYSVGYKPFGINSTHTISLLGETAYKNVYTDSTTKPYTAGTYVNLTTAQMTAKDALTAMSGFDAELWYAVDGKTPQLRTYGISLGDVNEDGAFELASDTAALRKGLIGAASAKNGDFNKNGAIDICDLVKLSGK